MKNDKNFTIAMGAIVALTFAYLIIMKMIGEVPTEKTIVLKGFFSEIPLEKPVSYWWNLIFFPIAMVGVTLIRIYSFKQDGCYKQLNKNPLNTSARYELSESINRSLLVYVLCIAPMITSFIDATGQLFGQNPLFGCGPITMTLMSILGGAILYTGMQIFSGIFDAFDKDFVWIKDPRTPAQVFDENIKIHMESGFVKRMPTIMGLMIGFIGRKIIEPIKN